MSTYLLALIVQLLVAQVGSIPCEFYTDGGYVVRKRGLHDIEIKTKRETAKFIQEPDEWGTPGKCPDGYHPIIAHSDCENNDSNICIGNYTVSYSCERITKTLYIDGQKIGVIRETEDK